MTITFAKQEPKQTKTASAILTVYRFDTTNPEQAAQYEALLAERKASGVKEYESRSPYCYDKKWADYQDSIRNAAGRPVNANGVFSAPVTIELDTVFDNQMNSAGPLNARLFDWTVYIYPNKDIKEGYYVESEELTKARATTCKCGYCGKQYTEAKPGQFCSACIDSEYLTFDTLHLLRLQYVKDQKDRPKLSKAESEELLPIFEEARTKGITERGKARIAKQRADILAQYEKTVSVAAIERDGKMWCNDNGIDTSLAIYYSHTGRWAFNWQERLNGTELERLRVKVESFPFAYDMK